MEYRTNIKSASGVATLKHKLRRKGMHAESENAGYFRHDLFDTRFDKLQILSIEELLDGKMPELPRSYEVGSFKKADRVEESDAQAGLF